MTLHRVACWLGSHLWIETFRYAPQGFASTYEVAMETCASCGRRRSRHVPKRGGRDAGISDLVD